MPIDDSAISAAVCSAPFAHAVFQMEDQRRFAEFSGDFNPMHLGISASRRTPAGAPAVHGMHQVLWALEHLVQMVPSGNKVIGLRVRFQNFLLINEEFHLALAGWTDEEARLILTAGGATCTDLIVRFARTDDIAEAQEPGSHADSIESPVCQELTFDDVKAASGNLPLRCGALDAHLLFPGAAANIGATHVTAIAALSRLVGMVCPGLHSIFRSADLRMVVAQQDLLHYSVVKADSRYSYLRQEVKGGGIEGSIEAFMRTPPSLQPSVLSIQQHISPGEFSHSTALIIGASRGLGEFTAKAIGAGGGHVVATYRVGQTECEEVAREIRHCGGACDVLQYDVKTSVAQQLRALPNPPTSLYYFATSKIFGRQSELFDPARFNEFTDVYLTGFFNLCLHLRNIGVQRLNVFYPSSSALESRPADMSVYAMAKAAGEVLCEEIAQRWPGFRVVVRRLPRLLTDQTSTVLSIPTPAVQDVLLPIIRDIEALHG
jgi:NAD(P)-dependent dehydrogenase (short-subunit alcohol dehydrogenase family)